MSESVMIYLSSIRKLIKIRRARKGGTFYFLEKPVAYEICGEDCFLLGCDTNVNIHY